MFKCYFCIACFLSLINTLKFYPDCFQWFIIVPVSQVTQFFKDFLSMFFFFFFAFCGFYCLHDFMKMTQSNKTGFDEKLF